MRLTTCLLKSGPRCGHTSSGSLLTDGLRDALQTGLHRGAGHGQIQADIAFGISYEQTVAALQQHAGFIGEEVGQVRRLRQHIAKVHHAPPCS